MKKDANITVITGHFGRGKKEIAFLEETGILSDQSILEALKKVLSPEKHSLLDINQRALILGRSLTVMKK